MRKRAGLRTARPADGSQVSERNSGAARPAARSRSAPLSAPLVVQLNAGHQLVGQLVVGVALEGFAVVLDRFVGTSEFLQDVSGHAQAERIGILRTADLLESGERFLETVLAQAEI